MLNWMKMRAQERLKAEQLYGVIVAAARRPEFYSSCGIHDTPEGRYEMIAVNLFLVLERLKGQGTEAETIARRVMEAFVTDMDDCMREMGVGDMSVGRKVKKSTTGLYQRFTAYRSAMALSREALAQQVSGFLPGLATKSGAPDAIADYMGETAEALAAQDLDDVLTGKANFSTLR